ncbi:MAG TPA: T3SS effector HopA1 family protein [Thermoanaerobaculia bacterium]|nr:T3SS effector HopA1 family protein [Thermoanaerobaculia bacterium]
MTADSGLRPVLESLMILSPDSFVLGEEPPQVVPAFVATVQGLPSHPLPADPLVSSLQGVFYSRAYIRDFGSPEPAPLPADPGFLDRLTYANRGRDLWDPGWEVYRTGPGGQLFVHKGDRHRSALPGEYVTGEMPGAVPRMGERVWLRAPRDSRTTQPGFYYLFGETLPGAWDDASLVRFYVHATADGVCGLIEYLTERLNRYLVPYRMKTLSNPAHFGRADGTVLYVARDSFQIVARIFRALPAPVAAGLRPRVPLFTWRLCPGVGVAEEPNTGESFGMHRCRLTAEGVVEAWRQGRQTLEARLQAVRDRFVAHGIRLDRPYLNPGSCDYFLALSAQGDDA